MPFPHPDDIVIAPETGVRFVGPTNEEGHAKLDDTIRLPDLFLVQDHYDHRVCTLDEIGDPYKGAGAALLLLHASNDDLPERFMLSIV